MGIVKASMEILGIGIGVKKVVLLRSGLKQTAIIHTPETEGPQTLIFEAEENLFKV